MRTRRVQILIVLAVLALCSVLRDSVPTSAPAATKPATQHARAVSVEPITTEIAEDRLDWLDWMTSLARSSTTIDAPPPPTTRPVDRAIWVISIPTDPSTRWITPEKPPIVNPYTPDLRPPPAIDAISIDGALVDPIFGGSTSGGSLPGPVDLAATPALPLPPPPVGFDPVPPPVAGLPPPLLDFPDPELPGGLGELPPSTPAPVPEPMLLPLLLVAWAPRPRRY